jgi:phosphatidylinositol alpha-1,6-mannosyltransferase
MSKKKILLVTRNFPPLMGGMEKLNLNIFRALSSRYEVFLAGPQGSKKFHKANFYTEFPVKPLWKYILFSLFKTIGFAIKVKPHIVFCGSGAAILSGYFSAKLTKASLVCYLHGLDIIVDNKIYQSMFLPLIKKSDLILVNSNHTFGLAIAAGIDPLRIKILSPGADFPDYTNKFEASKRFRLKYGIQDAPFILIAGRITARKGIAEFISNVMPAITAVYPQLQLIIIGNEAIDAMKRSSGVRDNIVAAVKAFNLQDNVKLIGSVNDEMLSAALFSAEVLVFPVLNIANDVEGFGMVAIEAAAHGLPTVGFSVGGIPDAISHNNSGWLVSPNDYSQMFHVILDRCSLSKPNFVTPDSCIEFAKHFSWDLFEIELMKILQGL